MWNGHVSRGDKNYLIIMAKTVTKKFKICDMHCVSCAMNIDFDLEDTEGVKKTSTSYAKSECVVEYEEEKLNENEIIDIIKNTGYKAEVI